MLGFVNHYCDNCFVLLINVSNAVCVSAGNKWAKGGGALSKVNCESRALRIIRLYKVCAFVFRRIDLAPLFVVLLGVDRMMKEEQSETLAPPQRSLTAGPRYTGITSLTAIITSLKDRLPLSVTVSISLALSDFLHLYLSFFCTPLSALFRSTLLHHHHLCVSPALTSLLLVPLYSLLRRGQGRVRLAYFTMTKMTTRLQEGQRFNRRIDAQRELNPQIPT